MENIRLLLDYIDATIAVEIERMQVDSDGYAVTPDYKLKNELREKLLNKKP